MTRRVALIGHPLKRRHSEVMHNAAFAHFGIDARYESRDLEADDVAPFVAEVRSGPWLGFQVTAPYKQVIIEHLDEVERDAAAIGAVNSVERRGDRALVGFNTDAPGFRVAAERELGLGFAGITAVVAGAGGAARAVVHALVAGGAAAVTVGNRTAGRAERLAADFGAAVRGVGYGTAFDGALATACLAVNATTVGMLAPGTAFDVRMLPGTAAVYDLVYQPAESELLRRARERGLRVANGLGMLVAQAELAFARWTGRPGAGEVMRKALDAESPAPVVLSDE
jgi:shikimate dehydrogenase